MFMPETRKHAVITVGGHAIFENGSNGGYPDYDEQQSSLDRVAHRLLPGMEAAVEEQRLLFRILSNGSGPHSGLLFDRGLRSAGGDMPMLDPRFISPNIAANLALMLNKAIYRALTETGKSIEQCLGEGTMPEGLTSQLTRFLVDTADLEPKKPVGRKLSEDESTRLRSLGYKVFDAQDTKGARLLVPSPDPRGVFRADLHTLQRNIGDGLCTNAAAAGGVPMKSLTEQVGGVVCKDMALAVLLSQLRGRHNVTFDTAAIVTDVPAIVEDFPTMEPKIKDAGGFARIEPPDLQKMANDANRIRVVTAEELRGFFEAGKEDGRVTGGSVPKIRAALRMATEAQVRRVIICNLDNLERTLLEPNHTEAGTTIMAESA